MRCPGQVVEGSREEVKAALADEERHIGKCEGGVVTGFAVFSGTKEKENSNPGKLHDGKVERRRMFGELSLGVMQDLEGKRLHAPRCGVGKFVGFVEARKAGVEGAGWSVPGVRGPQFGERLRDKKHLVANCRSLDWSATAAETSIAESSGEDPKHRDFVREMAEERVFDAEVG